MFGSFMPPGGGNDQMSQMIQIATLATQNPNEFAKIMAATGKPPPPLPPVEVRPLADITPKPTGAGLGPGPLTTPPPAPAPTPMPMPGVPMQPPVVTGTDIKQQMPMPGPASMAPGFNIGGLMQALGSLQAPPPPPIMRPEFAPAMPIRPGGQIDPSIMTRLIGMMSGAQSGVAPGAGLGGLIGGGR